MSWNVFYLAHSLWFVVYMFLYLCWSGLHFAMKVGTYSGCASEDYPRDLCPIYNILDWNKPKKTLKVSAGITFIVMPLVVLFIWCCARIRKKADFFKHQRQVSLMLSEILSDA